MMGIPFRSFEEFFLAVFHVFFFHIFSINFPVLAYFPSISFIAGDGDGIVSASDMEALAQALPKSTSATVANAGHVPMLEARGAA